MGIKTEIKETKEIEVVPRNNYLLEMFVRKIYGSPHSWSGGVGYENTLVVEAYHEFNIQTNSPHCFDDVKKKIIFHNTITKDEKKYLAKVARSRKLSIFNIDELVEKAKKDLSWKVRGVSA